jgi:hypothetical protein
VLMMWSFALFSEMLHRLYCCCRAGTQPDSVSHGWQWSVSVAALVAPRRRPTAREGHQQQLHCLLEVSAGAVLLIWHFAVCLGAIQAVIVVLHTWS